MATGRRKAADYLGEIVNFGGIPTARGEVIRQLREEGHDEARIGAWLSGYERGEAARRPREATTTSNRGA